jgi:L-ribulose-5-phosphate 3-epimerase
MKKAITLRAFPASMPTLDRCALARKAGFHGVELNLEPGLDVGPESSNAELLALGHAVREMGLEIASIYSREQWIYPITSANPNRRQMGLSIIRRLIEVAALLDIGAVLVIPGAVDNSLFGREPEVVRYDEAYKRAQLALRELLPLAASANTLLAIENVPNKFLLSPLEMARFVDELGHPSLGDYLDVGNAMMIGYPEHWIEILGRRIVRVHVKDYRPDVGGVLGFVGLLQGEVNWPAVATALWTIGYDGYITAEVLPPYRYHPERLVYEVADAISAIFGV